ncbi:MAG: hypothetical protein HY056_16275 [Proteobacteria bacterium]|nr:hypothetical protein [Pseudomonadota bacterium]
MPAGAADDATSMRALRAAYRCPIVDRLERIYEAGDPSEHRDRFIAVNVGGHPHGYVQCIFYDFRTKMLCEASSGFYFTKPGERRTFRPSATAIAGLARLGFSTDDSQGNFSVEFDVGAKPDFNAIADFMLAALHDGYGARAETTLTFNSPFAPRATTLCTPVG